LPHARSALFPSTNIHISAFQIRNLRTILHPFHVEHPAPRTTPPNRERFIEQFQNMDAIAQQFHKFIESNTESPHPFLREIASTSGRPSSKSVYPRRSPDHHILPRISLDLPMIGTMGRRNAFFLCGGGEMK
jgi:hypothetical protein